MAYGSKYYLQTTKDTIPASASATGEIYTVGTKVFGIGTAFTTEFQIYDYVYSADLSQVKQVVNIVSDTEMRLDSAFSSDLDPGHVDTLTIDNGGTGYTGAAGVATTGGLGTGLTVDTTDTAGVITAVVVNAPGSGYEVGDIVTVSGGGADATLEITAVLANGYALVKRFQVTKIEIDNVGGGNATLDGQTLANGKKVTFEKQPYGSSRATTDFVYPVVLDAVASDCQITTLA